MHNPLDWLVGSNRRSIPTVEEIANWLPDASSRPRRFLLLADIHANWHALVAVLRHARGRYDAIWFLGDIVGYGPRPVECALFVKRFVSPTRRWRVGNHDLGLMSRLDSAGGPYKPSNAARSVWEKHRLALQEEPALWRWFEQAAIRSRAKPALRRYGGFGQLFVHANPADLVGDPLYPDESFNILTHFQKAAELLGPHHRTVWLIVGHTHMVCLARMKAASSNVELLPISYGEPIEIRDAYYLINPGSVGQPRDGDRRAAYAIMNVRESSITYHRVDYDVIAVQREMQRAGIPDILVERLGTARIRDTQFFDSAYKRVSEQRPERLIPRV